MISYQSKGAAIDFALLRSIERTSTTTQDRSSKLQTSPAMATYLITGTSRGLGLALATHLASLPSSQSSTIFTLARKSSRALETLIEKSDGRVILIEADVTDEASIKKAVGEVETKLAGKGLDVLINNVGIMGLTPDGIAAM